MNTKQLEDEQSDHKKKLTSYKKNTEIGNYKWKDCKRKPRLNKHVGLR